MDIRGLIFLVGLLFSCFATVLIGAALPISYSQSSNAGSGEFAEVCNLITIGVDGSFSKIPIGISTLCFTLFYFVYIIVQNKLAVFNLPTLIFFPILILADFIWNISNNCYGVFGIITSVIVGSIIGLSWAAIISQLKQPNLLFLNIGSSQTVCSRHSKQLFKCTFPSVVSTTNKSGIYDLDTRYKLKD